jgi:ABC-type transport system involved in cytochrome c biogenesis permease subunit
MLILAATYILSGFKAPKATDNSTFDLNTFGRTPVLLGGRVKPLDTVARNTLLMLKSKQRLQVEDSEGKKRTVQPIEFLLDVLVRPEIADQYPIFKVDNIEALDTLKIDYKPEDPNKKAATRPEVSFAQLSPAYEKIGEEAGRIFQREEEEKQKFGEVKSKRSPFEKEIVRLQEKMTLYMRLKNSLQLERRLPGTESFKEEIQLFEKSVQLGLMAWKARQTGMEFNDEVLEGLRFFGARYMDLEKFAYMKLLPPTEAISDENSGPVDFDETKGDWMNMGEALISTIELGELPKDTLKLADIALAYQENRPEDFNRLVLERIESVEKAYPVKMEKAEDENIFNRAQPFYRSSVMYVLVFLLCVFSWLWARDTLNRCAFFVLMAALLFHTFGIYSRVMIQGYAPVTNLYSSAVFVGWGAVILAAILEKIYKNGIGNASAALIGFATLIIAHHLSLGGDTMEMMQAVLDSNFWLSTHVVTVTIGYSGTFLAGIIGIFYILRGLFTRSLTQADSKTLGGMAYGIVCFSALFSFVGTILGGIWADQSWGRFWGWDPKENGALMIVLWNAIILHARWGGIARTRGIMVMTVFGNIITALSWFGVNMLGVGLHSYGFMEKSFLWLMGFIASQFVLIGLGMIPMKYWRSFQKAKGSESSASDAVNPAPNIAAAPAK